MSEERIERLARTWIATGQQEELDATVNGLSSMNHSLCLDFITRP